MAAERSQARTRLARAAITDAARELFLERGFGATTMDAISEAADVPIASVYRLFSSKHGILKAVLDVSIAGDDEEIPVSERPEVQALLTDADPQNQLAGFVRISAAINERVAPIYRILLSAASADREAAALLDELANQRQQGQRAIARSLVRSGALRVDVRERDAADVIHALMSPEMYRLLVVDRRWTTARYERWLTETVTHQLLRER
ncbi:MAG: helix-turn-helix domain-containing protein [Acidimicrobiales bacterium]|nr:helix-turn-helix domain-containing protein [Acidimicrobiales bacterium]